MPRRKRKPKEPEDYEISESESQSESESVDCSSEEDEDSDASEYKPSGRASRAKKRNKRKTKMHVDETDDDEEEEEDDDDDVDHVFEDQESKQLLPERIVYFKYDAINDDIAQLHQVMNNKHSKKTSDLFLMKKAMDFVLHNIDETISQLMETEDVVIFDKIVEFAQNSYAPRTPLNAMNFMWSMHQYVIPTAMLMCGQNISDHALHFERLYHNLKTNVSPLIVRFTANDLKKNGSFASKLYDVQRYIVESIFNTLSEWKVAKQNNKMRLSPTNARKTRVTRAEKVEVNTEYFDMKRCLKLPSLKNIKNEIVRTFILWYFEHAHIVDKYWTLNEDNASCLCLNNLPKIVLMIDSIEQWSPAVLTSLIYTLHSITENYRDITNTDHIPFVLVMGVSTTEDLLSRMVECEAVRLLSVQQFYFKGSHKLYIKLAEEILIKSSPILFDESILNKLLNHCQLNDYSVARFKEQIRYLFMAYFRSTPCCQYAAYFMDYDVNKSAAERLQLLKEWWTDEEEEFVIQLLENTEEYNEGDEMENFMEYLHDTYLVYERYRESLKVFKMITDHLDFKWNTTQIIAKLQNKEMLFKHLLCRVGADKMPAEERAMFKPRIQHFEECHAIYKILEAETEIFDKDFSKQAANEYKIITTRLEDKTAAQQASDASVDTKKKKMNAKQQRLALKRKLTKQTNKDIFDKGRKNLFELLKSFICKHLKPMNELPLNEIFVYKKEKEFSRDMLPPTNTEIRNRFENYRQYFGDIDGITAEAMSCVYDVYNETDGLYLNLHDAYVAFKARFTINEEIQIEDKKKKKKKKKKKSKKGKKKKKKKKRSSKKQEMSDSDSDLSDDNEDNDKNYEPEKEKKTQVQFRLAVDDLRFCGFVKATNRKKQTLMKLADLV